MTDTNRLARARALVAKWMQPPPTRKVYAEQIAQFAEREAKAAVEWSEGNPPEHGDYLVRAATSDSNTKYLVGFYDGRWWDVASAGKYELNVIAYQKITPYQPKEEQDA